jgi:Domain of unknown function (DUF4465)/Secretion system C-terminal sorting domain
MRHLFFAALLAVVLPTKGSAQTVATFDDLSLPTADTYYVNYTAYGSDVGFNDGLGYFPCVYDTSYGTVIWNYFAYSNKTDSVTSGYTNQYSAKTGVGYGGSSKYAVAYCSNPITYASTMTMRLTGAAVGHPVSGFYATNSTYVYNAIAQGYPAAAPARKFHSGDFFLLTVKGFHAGSLTTDSVNFYLADFLNADTTLNYIVKTWEWVDCSSLGNVDSLQFSLASSDTGSFGMNTPSYFCMDNFTTNETDVAVAHVGVAPFVTLYPNPASDYIVIDGLPAGTTTVEVYDMLGIPVMNTTTIAGKVNLNIAALPSGDYTLHIGNDASVARFTKIAK